MASTVDNIISDANSIYDQFVALGTGTDELRAEQDALAAEDPCSPGFLDRLNAIAEKGANFTDQKTNIWNQLNDVIKQYNELGVVDSALGDTKTASDAIAKAKALYEEINAKAKAYGGPAKRQAMKDANAKCSVDGTANKSEQSTAANDDANPEKTAENKQNSDSAEENTSKSSSQAIAAGTAGAGSEVTPDGQKSSSATNSSGAPLTPASAAWPGKRKDNPLSKLSSYVYSISLYMVTPEAMNKFIAAGGSLSALKGRDTGVYVVAQSGGINTDIEDRLLTFDGTLGKGKPGFDYYIDDLVINTLLPGGANRSTTSTEVKFKIIEPMGFTFLQDIAKASAALNAKSDIVQEAIKSGQAPNGFKQHYILGIKFYGYDVNGNIVDANNPAVAGYDNGGSDGDQSALIQRYFAIKFANMKFTLDGKMVTYNCEALVISEHAAYGQINGRINEQLTITAGTVGEALNGGTGKVNGLAQILNENTTANKDRKLIDIDNKIKFEFLDKDGKVVTDHPIAKAGLLDDTTFVADTAPMTGATRTDKVTIADSFKASSFDKNKKQITITAGSHILTAVDNIIVKSNYVTNALKQTVSQDVEGKNVEKPVSQTLKWYSVNPYVQVVPWDKKTNNWTYDVVYQITEYEVPYIRSSLPGITSKYPGPFKFYQYLMTGKNTEVLSYSQQYDNLFYTVASMSTSPDLTTKKAAKGSAPVVPKNATDSDQNSGAQNKGSELNNNVRAQLYSPGDQSQAKIKILGDPDYIMTSIGVKATSASKFYGKDSSINPSGGQTFIQMVFNMATDYGAEGLLDITDQLQFYKTDKVKKAGIDGIVYMVVQVESTFSKGTFTQVLDCLMVDEALLVTETSNSGTAGGTDENQSQAETNRLAATATQKTAAVSNQATAVGTGGVGGTVNLGNSSGWYDDTAAGDGGGGSVVTTEVRTGSMPDEDSNSGSTSTPSSTIASAQSTTPEEPPNNALTEGRAAVLDDRLISIATQANDDYIG